MSRDINKLSQRAGTSPGVESVHDLYRRAGLDAVERIRELVDPMGPARSLIETTVSEQALQRRMMLDALGVPTTAARAFDLRQEQLATLNSAAHVVDEILRDSYGERYRSFLTSPAELAMRDLLERTRELERAIGIHGPAQAAIDAAGTRRMMDEVLRASDPYREMIDQFRMDQTASTAWLQKLYSAAETVNRFAAWPLGNESPDQLQWNILDERLADVEAAIQELPEAAATPKQLQGAGLTRKQWAARVLFLLSILLPLLDLLVNLQQLKDDRKQNAEQQAFNEKALAEQRAFHERLLALVAELAERAPPTQATAFVVADRPAVLKSAPKQGRTMATVYPNQEVVVIDHEGRWVKIRFQDHVANCEREGWVLKHYLARLEPSEPDLP